MAGGAEKKGRREADKELADRPLGIRTTVSERETEPKGKANNSIPSVKVPFTSFLTLSFSSLQSQSQIHSSSLAAFACALGPFLRPAFFFSPPAS